MSDVEPNIILRPALHADEDAARAAHSSMLDDDFTFLLNDYTEAEPWDDYLERLEDQRTGRNLAAERVPATFLLAVSSRGIVGRTSVRHGLNDFLATYGGHIGYGVLAPYRRQGYASEILRQSLIIARAVGIEDVLVTCDDANLASAKTIERCGGLHENTIDGGPGAGQRTRRYWITGPAASKQA